MRISKKSLAQFPKAVSEKIIDIAEDYKLKSFGFRIVPAGYKMYAGEGERITIVYGDESKSIEMVSANNIGGSGMRHEIGAEVELPVGAFEIKVGYYGGYYMAITNVVNAVLP